jgi:uncharacterized cysteine cluster protein YcgN (CxxCxxCC family)
MPNYRTCSNKLCEYPLVDVEDEKCPVCKSDMADMDETYNKTYKLCISLDLSFIFGIYKGFFPFEAEALRNARLKFLTISIGFTLLMIFWCIAQVLNQNQQIVFSTQQTLTKIASETQAAPTLTIQEIANRSSIVKTSIPITQGNLITTERTWLGITTNYEWQGTRKTLPSTPKPLQVRYFALSPEEDNWVYRELNVQDTVMDRLASQGNPKRTSLSGIVGMKWSPNGLHWTVLLNVAGDSLAELWWMPTESAFTPKQEGKHLIAKGRIDAFAWLPNSDFVVYAFNGQESQLNMIGESLHFFNTVTKSSIDKPLQLPDDISQILSISVAPDNNTIALIGITVDSKAKIFMLTLRQQYSVIQVTEITNFSVYDESAVVWISRNQFALLNDKRRITIIDWDSKTFHGLSKWDSTEFSKVDWSPK